MLVHLILLSRAGTTSPLQSVSQLTLIKRIPIPIMSCIMEPSVPRYLVSAISEEKAGAASTNMPPQNPVINLKLFIKIQFIIQEMNLPTSNMALFLASSSRSHPAMKGTDTAIRVHFLPMS